MVSAVTLSELLLPKTMSRRPSTDAICVPVFTSKKVILQSRVATAISPPSGRTHTVKTDKTSKLHGQNEASSFFFFPEQLRLVKIKTYPFKP